MEEIWKAIKGFYDDELGGYEISTYGRLRNTRVLKRRVDSRGNAIYPSSYNYKKRSKAGLFERVVKVTYPKGSVLTMKSANYLHYYLQNPVNREGCLKYAHILVMETFNPTDDPNLEVNHKDGNKLNNRLDNLEWVTHQENMRHAVGVLGRKLGLHCEKSYALQRFYKYKAEKYYGSISVIYEIRDLYDRGELTREKIKEYSNKYNVSRDCIRHIAKRETYAELD